MFKNLIGNSESGGGALQIKETSQNKAHSFVKISEC